MGMSTIAVLTSGGAAYDAFPMQYGAAKNNLGSAYGTLAEVEDKAGNCRLAIAAHEEALRVRAYDAFPMGYGMTQNNLGNVYRTLAEVEDKANNCRLAIAAYEEALRVFESCGLADWSAMARKSLNSLPTICR